MQVTGNRAWGANSAYFCCKLKWALANTHGWYYGVVLLRAAAVMVEAYVQASAFDNHYPFCGAQCMEVNGGWSRRKLRDFKRELSTRS